MYEVTGISCGAHKTLQLRTKVFNTSRKHTIWEECLFSRF